MPNKITTQSPMNCFLKSRQEVDECTQTIKNHGLTGHGLYCKNWDLTKIIPYLDEGNILDMGCNDSFILHNCAALGLGGIRYGIDLIDTASIPGCKFFQGDLMHTPFESGLFKSLTCLSVVEHGVDFDALAKECSRLLSSGGKVFITFDYWDPKINTSTMRLYNLPWNILDKNEVNTLVDACAKHQLVLDRPIDWATQDAVIAPGYFSPYPVSYTFGILMFVKQ